MLLILKLETEETMLLNYKLAYNGLAISPLNKKLLAIMEELQETLLSYSNKPIIYQ
jgi:hypothetical protein